MRFRKYKHIDDVAHAYQLSYRKANFLSELPTETMPTHLRDDLAYVMANIPYNVSEAAIRENILYPILKETFKRYDDTLMIWANRTISYGKELGGMPDYLIAKQSHLGKVIFGKPLMAVVEAKKDDFAGGWAQCLLEMYAIQKINNSPETPVYGIVSNGENWEFGMLYHSQFTENAQFYTIQQPDELFSVLLLFFEKCKENALML